MFYKTEQQNFFIKNIDMTLRKRLRCHFSISEINEMAKRYVSGEKHLFQTLLESQYKLIYKTVVNFINKHNITNEQVSYDDLASEAFLCATNIIDKYNPSKISFSSYIQTYVSFHLLNVVKVLGRVVKIPVYELQKVIAHKNNKLKLNKELRENNTLERPTTYNYSLIKDKDNNITYGTIKDFSVLDIDEVPLEKVGVETNEDCEYLEYKIKSQLQDWEWDLYYYRSKLNLNFSEVATHVTPQKKEDWELLRDTSKNEITIRFTMNGNAKKKTILKYAVKSNLSDKFRLEYPDLQVCNKQTIVYKLPVGAELTEILKNGETISNYTVENSTISIPLSFGCAYNMYELKKDLKTVKNKMYYYYGKFKDGGVH